MTQHTPDSDTDTEHVLEQLQALFERDDITHNGDDEGVPYDVEVERRQRYGKADFYLEPDEADQLREIPVHIHEVTGRLLRLELVPEDESESESDSNQED